MFGIHFLGPQGMEKYIQLYRKHGEQKADQIMAYGNDPDDPKFKGVGGPDSTIPNVLVSDHLINFKINLDNINSASAGSGNFIYLKD
jgi:hypothetical protein